MLKSTITGVPTALTPYPFPSLFFLVTSFSVCSLHGPHKLNSTRPDEFFTYATRLEGRCKFSIDCNTVCSSKTLRFRGSHVKKRRIHASFFGSSKIFKRGLSVNSSFDVCYISSSLDLSKTLSLRRLTQAESMFTVLTFRVIVKVLP